MVAFKYPSEEKIIELNALILTVVKVKKADKSEVLSKLKLSRALDACIESDGDLYDKAAILMKQVIKSHAFASGNRRTAFIVTKYFVTQNKGKFKIKDDPSYAQVMQGIRENFYSKEEIKEWIKNGTIKPFKR
ncbi:type II toxin-antitoxin system death-on-curing family toxin [Candidatus Woesearchaeota archaeon]|nr:type II toxin-antitoxin system death-on-curing family toxin [Candidatus Woesearchaeota archaeon]